MSELRSQHEQVTQRFNHIKAELSASGIHGLVGRLQRGLDPMGMLVVAETKKIIHRVCAAVGVDDLKLRSLTEELHFGGIWKNAERLAAATHPEVQVWMLLASATNEVNDHDLMPDDFLKDVDRIIGVFQAAATNPQEALAQAIHENQAKAKTRFTKEDGVAIANGDAFLFMAMSGERAGVSVSGDLLFVGSDKLDYASIVASHGLREERRPDPHRGGESLFYVGDNGVEVKVIGKGFCIVFGHDLELAKALARTGQQTV